MLLCIVKVFTVAGQPAQEHSFIVHIPVIDCKQDEFLVNVELEAKMLPSMYPGFEKRNRILGGQLRLPDSIDDFNFPLERFIVKGSFDESFR